VTGGLALSYVPAMPSIELAPNLVFDLFLPPLLYYAAWRTSWRDFRRNLGTISWLAIGLVLTTTGLVAAVAHWGIGMQWPAAFVLGAIVSPTDAVAATSVAQRLGVPRRIITIVEGESLVNDATGIVAYRLAVAAVLTGIFSFLHAGFQFLAVGTGGILVGLLVGWVIVHVRRRLRYADVENTVTLITPFAAYFAAEELHVSGVLASVTVGLYVARYAPRLTSPDTRLKGIAFWDMLDFLLNSVLFLLVGLELRSILKGTGSHEPYLLIGYALLISFTVIAARIAWVFPATYLPQLVSRRLRQRDPYPPWRNVTIVALTGLRGAVSLAAALALPYATSTGSPFPTRDLIIFLTSSVILVTLVLQGLSLPTLIRALKLHDDRSWEKEEAWARLRIANSALKKVEQLVAGGELEVGLANRMRADFEHRLKHAEADLAEGESVAKRDDGYRDSDHRARAEALKVERECLIEMREQGVINDEVMHRIERDLDLEEVRLRATH
jgi:CPA1 family monovalent cation:H+ antiporter